jgi:hypothetical protein
MTARLRCAFRPAALLALVLGLAGCFKSEAPLIDKASAKFPFQTISLTIDGETEVLTRDGDVYRRTENDKPSEATLLIHEIAENLFIVQESQPEGEATYLFARKQDDKVIVRSDCKGLGADMLARLNIEAPKTEKTIFLSCKIKDLEALIGLGQSPDLWSGETHTLQIVSME